MSDSRTYRNIDDVITMTVDHMLSLLQEKIKESDNTRLVGKYCNSYVKSRRSNGTLRNNDDFYSGKIAAFKEVAQMMLYHAKPKEDVSDKDEIKKSILKKLETLRNRGLYTNELIDLMDEVMKEINGL